VNASLLDECNDSCYKCEDLEAELRKVCSDTTVSIAALEAKVKSAETYSAEVAAASNKRSSDFETELTRDLAGLRKLYVHNVQSLGRLCSLVPEGDLSAADYIRWLSTEVAGFSEMFAGVNENFISGAVEGTLVMADQSIDLGALQDAAAMCEVDILAMERDVQRDARMVLKKWWRSFGYDYVLGAIRVKLREVTTDI
jgi:hypothetical protein